MERNQWLYSHHRWLLRGIGTQTTLAGISTLENTVLGPATITSVMLREDCKLNCHVRKAAMAQEIEGCCQLCGRNHLGKSLTLCALVSVSVKWLWWVPALPAVTGVLPFPTIIHRGIQYMLENLPRADECEASLSFWSSLGLGTFFLISGYYISQAQKASWRTPLLSTGWFVSNFYRMRHFPTRFHALDLHFLLSLPLRILTIFSHSQ